MRHIATSIHPPFFLKHVSMSGHFDNVIIFSTRYGNYYMYSLLQKTFHCISENEFNILRAIERGLSVSEAVKQCCNSDIDITEYQTKIDNYLAYISRQRVKEVITTNVVPQNIYSQLANKPSICFEVTESCNLRCAYCAYGDFYEGYEPRQNSNLSFEKAKAVIDMVMSYCNTQIPAIHISFYGGEPLLRFDLIKQVIEYVSGFCIDATYSMTTNAMLLDKYIDFLIENKFALLISLDGNKSHNGFRLQSNGEESFDKVFSNIKSVQINHPQYFNECVNFNVVLHKKNNVSDVLNYFDENFGKTPSINYVSPSMLRQDKKKEFEEMLQNLEYDNVKQRCDHNVYDRYNKQTAEYKEVMFNLKLLTSCYYSNYIDLLSNGIKRRLHTATCFPFWKKMFVTSQGLILPCENVPHSHSLGNVGNAQVECDIPNIAEQFTDSLKTMMQTCSACYNRMCCDVCLWQKKQENGRFNLSCFHTKSDMEAKLANMFSFIEENPTIYNTVLNSENYG